MEIYSFKEIAAAAGVPAGHVERHVIASGVPSSRGWIAEGDAVRLVREIAAARPAPSDHPTFFAVVKSRAPRPKGRSNMCAASPSMPGSTRRRPACVMSRQ